MNAHEMVVLIIAIVGITGVLKAKYGHRRRDGRYPAEANPDADRLREEVRALKDRIAVLERIATENDRGLSLDREIEKLRSRD